MDDGVFGTSNTPERSTNNPSRSSGISINGSSFATQNDPIAAKREEARKKVMKIIGDAFANHQIHMATYRIGKPSFFEID